jgi:hypothetical protein
MRERALHLEAALAFIARPGRRGAMTDLGLRGSPRPLSDWTRRDWR